MDVTPLQGLGDGGLVSRAFAPLSPGYQIPGFQPNAKTSVN